MTGTRGAAGVRVGGSAAAAVIGFTAFTDSAVVALVLLSLSYGCVIFANGSMWAQPLPLPGRQPEASVEIAP